MNFQQVLSLTNAPQSTSLDYQGGMLDEGRTPGGSDVAMSKGRKQRIVEHEPHGSELKRIEEIVDPHEDNNDNELEGFSAKGPSVVVKKEEVVSTVSPSPVAMPPELSFAIPAERRDIINRIVRATGLREAMRDGAGLSVSRSWHPLQVRQRQFDDRDYRINAPYGMLGLAVNATPEELRDMVAYCEVKKHEFIKKGDYDMARLFGNRQDMISGILSHLTQFGLV